MKRRIIAPVHDTEILFYPDLPYSLFSHNLFWKLHIVFRVGSADSCLDELNREVKKEISKSK